MASGVAEDFQRGKHVKYFSRCLQVLPARYASLDTTRMTVAFFALSGLDMLDAINTISKDKIATIDWIYSLQIVPNRDESNLDFCGFRGSTTIGKACDTATGDVHGNNKYDCGHIAMTYTALLSLLILEDDLSKVNRKGIVAGLKKLQLSDGSFCPTLDGSENDMRFVYCASCISYIMDDWSGMDINRAITFIKNSLSYEGAFGQGPGLEAHGGSTFCAVASLGLMNKLHEVLAKSQIDKLIHWCILRQESGFQGRPNKPVDTCYSFWIGATLKLIGAFDMIDYTANRLFLMETQDTVVGGFAKSPDASPDTLHAYFGICGLSLMGESGVSPMHAALNISQRCVDSLEAIHEQWQKINSVSVLQNGVNQSSDVVAGCKIKNDIGSVSSDDNKVCDKPVNNCSIRTLNQGNSPILNLQVDQHVMFLKNGLKSLKHETGSVDISRLNVVYAALSGLDLLNAIQTVPVEEKQHIIDWIYSLHILPTQSHGASSSSKGTKVPNGNYGQVPLTDSSDITLMYTVICSLLLLGDNLSNFNREAVISYLSDVHQTDGSFHSSKNKKDANLKFTYIAICISYMLQNFTAFNVQKVIQHLQSCMNKDSAFGYTPGISADEESTFYAIASLKLIDNVQKCLSNSDIEKLKKWCGLRHEDRFKQNTKQHCLSAYCFWIGGTLQILGCPESISKEQDVEFILQSQHTGLGGFVATPGQLSDMVQTDFSLRCLALHDYIEMNRLNLQLGLTHSAQLNLQKQWRSSGGQTAL